MSDTGGHLDAALVHGYAKPLKIRRISRTAICRKPLILFGFRHIHAPTPATRLAAEVARLASEVERLATEGECKAAATAAAQREATP